MGGPVAAGAGAEPAGDGGHEPLVDGGEQYVVADAVELYEDGAGGGGAGRGGAASALGEAVEAAAVGVVVAYGEGAAGGGGDGGHHGGDHDCRLRRRGALFDGVDLQGEPQQGAVEEEHQQTEDERRHEQQQTDQQRPDQGGEQTEGAGAEGGGDRDVGGAVAVGRAQAEVGKDTGEQEHGEGGDHPHGDTPPDLTGDPSPPPATHAPHTSRPGRPGPLHPVTTAGRGDASPYAAVGRRPSRPAVGSGGRRCARAFIAAPYDGPALQAVSGRARAGRDSSVPPPRRTALVPVPADRAPRTAPFRAAPVPQQAAVEARSRWCPLTSGFRRRPYSCT
ncbi:hypothetical protein SHKM778_34560 [Streptomyces sp. KM77-8]|uniref:Uncharacterized protein n=1 Tax=Streptomyces haneummycinicus TaxID=3074435 RepID=A0AAT9HI18_9ACTN